MIRSFICLLLITGIFSNTASAQTSDEKSIAAAVESLRKAMVDADKPVLEKLAADELSYGHSSGKIEDKASFVDAIASGKSDFVSIELAEQTIKVVGNTAIVRHLFNAVTNDGGKPGTVKLAVLLIWEKQNKEWKLLARQATKILPS
jgi:ketosteroid isomerase-like protein